MALANETLHLFLILTGFIAFYLGAKPVLKIVAGHLPSPGLRQAVSA